MNACHRLVSWAGETCGSKGQIQFVLESRSVTRAVAPDRMSARSRALDLCVVSDTVLNSAEHEGPSASADGLDRRLHHIATDVAEYRV